MSKGKKGKGSVDIAPSKDDSIVSEILNDDQWHCVFVFLTSRSAGAEEQLAQLTTAAREGHRKRFHVIDKQDLLEMATEDSKSAAAASGGGGKKSKMGSGAPAEALPHVQVCQQAATCISNNEEISSALLAKLLKYSMLKTRRKVLSEKEAPKEVVESGKSKKGATSGRTSKAGKKGKETPAVDSQPSVAVPVKPQTSMLKRGEEQALSKYINDEPEKGPSCYFLLTGFSSVELFKEFDAMQLPPFGLVSLVGLGNSESGEDSDFASNVLKTVQSSPATSMLYNMVFRDLTMSASGEQSSAEEGSSVGLQLFNNLSETLYFLLDQYTQYQKFLSLLDLQPMPAEPPTTPDSSNTQSQAVLNGGLYQTRPRKTTQQCCTIPLIMNGMIEQVCAQAEDNLNADNINKSETFLSNELDNLLLCLKNNKDIDECSSSNYPVISAVDHTASDFYQHLPALERDKALQTHRKMLSLSSISASFTQAEESFEYQHILKNSFNSAKISSTISLDQLRFYLLLMSLERIQLPSAAASPSDVEQVPHFVFDDCIGSPENFKELLKTHPQLRDLTDTCSQQILSNHEILQILQGALMSHPYIRLAHSKYLGYTALIAHSGCNGSNAYTHNKCLRAPAKVGFQSFLLNYSEQYADLLDNIPDLMLEKHEEEGDVSEEKEKSPEEERSAPISPDTSPVHKINAYDLDGKALIGQDTMSTLFSSNGTILKGQKYAMAKSSPSVSIWLENKSSFVSSSLQWKLCVPNMAIQDEVSGPSSIGAVMPSQLLRGSFYATLEGELTVSTSCYGSSGNQELPYHPPKPKILEESRSGSPDTQPVAATQKLNKKQLEQQQQLLQQQKILEEQRAQQKNVARKQYQAKLDGLKANNKNPQLFATTRSGLHLHCQVLDVDTTQENAVLVRQSLNDDKNLTSSPFKERYQCCLGDGHVIRFLQDGSIIAIAPDGSIFQTASQSQQAMLNEALSQEKAPDEGKADDPKPLIWLVTTPDGKRYVWKSKIAPTLHQDDGDEQQDIETNDSATESESKSPSMATGDIEQEFIQLPPLKVTQSTDPVSNEVFWTREDGVLLLYKPDHSLIVQFADGMRCTATTTPEQTISTVCIENPGFASVFNDITNSVCQVTLPNGFTIHCSNTGEYDVRGLRDTGIKAKADGSVIYSIEDKLYNFCHNGVNNTLESKDEAGQMFRMSIDGSGSVTSSDKDLSTKAFTPYFFIKDAGGEFFQLLDTNSVSKITSANEGGNNVILKETKPARDYITLIKPNQEESAPELIDISPDNVKSECIETVLEAPEAKQRFGTCIGKGLFIKPTRSSNNQKMSIPQPKFLQFTHFIQREELSSEKRDQVLASLASLKNAVPTDEALKESAALDEQTVVFETEQERLGDVYTAAREVLSSKLESAKTKASVSKDLKSKISAELSEAAQLKCTLKQKVIPSYDSFPRKAGCSTVRNISPRIAPFHAPPQVIRTAESKDVDTTYTGESSIKQKRPDVKRRPTTREAKVNMVKQQVEVSTSQVDFGDLKEGSSYRISISLKNVGVVPCRFKIKQPPAKSGIKVLYSPGQIAPGMTRPVVVELYALDCGDIRHTLEIISEMNTVLLPVIARVHD